MNNVRKLLNVLSEKDSVMRYYLPEHWGILTEGGISRIWKQVNEDRVPFIIISAYKTVYDEKSGKIIQRSYRENATDNAKLVAKIREKGLGATVVQGGWRDPNTNKVSLERSFFVPLIGTDYSVHELELFGKRWAIEFEQQAILFGDGDKVYCLNFNVDWMKPDQNPEFTDKEVIGSQLKVTYKDIEFFTKRKNQVFVFEGTLSPDSMLIARKLAIIEGRS